jgi:nucleotide-binding universal stress UspA family protein
MIPKIKTILYATDLSKNSAYAFFYAVDMARGYNARIIILHAVEPGRRISYAGPGVQAMMGKVKKEEQEADLEQIKNGLQDICKKIEAKTGQPCLDLVSKILVPLGHPVEEILRAVGEEGCDAMVLGTHGKGFLKQTILGDVAARVLQRTRKPVFIIPLPSEKIDIDWDKL